MKKIYWGVLGTAKIGRQKVIPAMPQGAHGDIVAMASRDARKARKAAERLNIPKAYDAYERLLADGEPDPWPPMGPGQELDADKARQGIG